MCPGGIWKLFYTVRESRKISGTRSKLPLTTELLAYQNSLKKQKLGSRLIANCYLPIADSEGQKKPGHPANSIWLLKNCPRTVNRNLRVTHHWLLFEPDIPNQSLRQRGI